MLVICRGCKSSQGFGAKGLKLGLVGLKFWGTGVQGLRASLVPKPPSEPILSYLACRREISNSDLDAKPEAWKRAANPADD